MKQHRQMKSQNNVEGEFKSLTDARLRIDTIAGAKFFFAPANRFIRLSASILFLCFLSQAAHCQWRKLLERRGGFLVIDFLNSPGAPRVGFASELDSVFRTEDGGNTWQAIPMGTGTVLTGLDVASTDFTFKDSLTGWMSANGGQGGAYITTDGGENWKFLVGSESESSAQGIYYDSSTNRLFLTGWVGYANPPLVGSVASSDEGKTWIPINASKGWAMNGFAFNDSLHGINSCCEGRWLRTTDGGASWSGIVMDSEIWQPLAIPGTSTQFAITDMDGTVLRTDDEWDTWKQIYQFPIFMYNRQQDADDDATSSGTIVGDSCHLFVLLRDGCYMSTDQGIDWTFLGGMPSVNRICDQRLCYSGNKIYIQTYNADIADAGIWMLDLDSLNPPYVGISPRLDNGAQQTTLHPGDSVGVTFVPGAGTLAATDSVTLTLRYDPNAVSLASLTVPSGWWIADSSRRVRASKPELPGAACLTVTLRSDSAESLPDPLLHAEFHTYLTPSREPAGGSQAESLTYIYLDSAQSFFPQTTPCAPTALSLEQPDSVEIDFTGCGDSTILAAMEGQPPFTIASIVPNPASTSLTVTVSGDPLSGMDYQLFDALGNCVLTEPGVRRTPLQMDVSALPSGVYFLRLSSGGYAVSRSVAIER